MHFTLLPNNFLSHSTLLRKALLFATIFLVSFSSLFAQMNIELIGQIPLSNNASDIWGYTHQSGVEYAIVGVFDGTEVISLEDPTNPEQIFFEPGPGTIWRDIKVWGEYAYVINEGAGGLLILDMREIPSSIVPIYWDGSNDANYDVFFDTAHNVFIDENGICYLVGHNEGVGGAIMLDLNVDPINPPIIGIYDERYIHDLFVRGDTMWSAEIDDGIVSIVDVSDKANPDVWSSFATPDDFAHNCWLSDDGKVLATTDEVSGGYVATYDVSNIFDVKELDRIQSSPGENVIPHNSFYKDNFIVTSFYTDGVTIHDATLPNFLIETGNYDTSPSFSGDGFNGAWGVYPYFPSGLIIASDIETGLYVLYPTYTSASYAVGNITDANTGMPIAGVSVSIDETDISTSTDFDGSYQTGIGEEGFYNMTFSSFGYDPVTFTVVLEQGVVQDISVVMTPAQEFPFVATIVDGMTNEAIANANILIESNDISIELVADENGIVLIESFYGGTYDVYAGQWAYRTELFKEFEISAEDGSIVLPLYKGYYDDFLFENFWNISGTAPVGVWERAIPVGTNAPQQGPSNPGSDSDMDFGKYAYVTGNASSDNVGFDDVDSGTTTLSSPEFDLTNYGMPVLNYEWWFFNGGGAGPINDILTVRITNGFETAEIQSVEFNEGSDAMWGSFSVSITDEIALTNTMRVVIETSDSDDSGHLVEAGFDVFNITEGLVGIDNNIDANPQSFSFSVYPNPSSDFIKVNLDEKLNLESNLKVSVYSLDGKLLIEQKASNSEINISQLTTGTYLIKVSNSNREFGTGKFNKL